MRTVTLKVQVWLAVFTLCMALGGTGVPDAQVSVTQVSVARDPGVRGGPAGAGGAIAGSALLDEAMKAPAPKKDSSRSGRPLPAFQPGGAPAQARSASDSGRPRFDGVNPSLPTQDPFDPQASKVHVVKP